MTKIYVNNAPAPKLDTVKQTVLQIRKSTHRDTMLQQQQKKASIRRKTRKCASKIKSIDWFMKDSMQCHYTKQRIDNLKKRKKPEFFSAVPKLGIVVRLGGVYGLTEKVQNIFKALRLDTFNQAVFVKIDKKMLLKLEMIRPWIAWGYPSVETVNNLLRKRGWLDMDGKRVRMSNPAMIESQMGDIGVLCLADIAHELLTVSENFDRVSRALWPFKLLSPSPTMVVHGNRLKNESDEPAHQCLYIDELLSRMI